LHIVLLIVTHWFKNNYRRKGSLKPGSSIALPVHAPVTSLWYPIKLYDFPSKQKVFQRS
jgi:hypothetical protein